jgi:hypothetical protein
MSEHLEIWRRETTNQRGQPPGFYWQLNDAEDHGPFESFDKAAGDFNASRAVARFDAKWKELVGRQ